MDVIGIDHIYLAVSDFATSEAFYDRVMRALGFYKGDRSIGGERHAHYFNRVLQLSIRPARSATAHDPYAPGLHHLCLQVATPDDVDAAYASLQGLGIAATRPRTYPEYSADYYATFFVDPDGIRLEIVARRQMRDDIVREWNQLRSFLNPLQELRSRRHRPGRPRRTSRRRHRKTYRRSAPAAKTKAPPSASPVFDSSDVQLGWTPMRTRNGPGGRTSTPNDGP